MKGEWKGGDHEHLVVTEEDVAEVVAKWTGVPPSESETEGF